MVKPRLIQELRPAAGDGIRIGSGVLVVRRWTAARRVEDASHPGVDSRFGLRAAAGR
jgi:hypothetical protein